MPAQATPHMLKSTVVDSATGKSVDSMIRTSQGTFFRRSHDEVVAEVERRIAEFSMVPEENGEGIQILKYEGGQKYEASPPPLRRRVPSRLPPPRADSSPAAAGSLRSDRSPPFAPAAAAAQPAARSKCPAPRSARSGWRRLSPPAAPDLTEGKRPGCGCRLLP